MYPLVTLQVVVPVEALRALIAFERPVVRCWLLLVRVSEEVRHVRCVSAIEALHHARVHATNHRHLAVRVVNVREYRRWR